MLSETLLFAIVPYACVYVHLFVRLVWLIVGVCVCVCAAHSFARICQVRSARCFLDGFAFVCAPLSLSLCLPLFIGYPVNPAW